MSTLPAWPAARGASDLATLAVKAHNVRLGLGATQPPQAAARTAEGRGPATALDERTRALAETAAKASAGQGEGMQALEEAVSAAQASEGDSTRRREFGRKVFVEMAMDADRGEVLARLKVSSLQQVIRKFEETGEVWHEDGAGGIKPHPSAASMTYAHLGGPAGYIEDLRKSMEQGKGQRLVATMTENARRAWESYQNWAHPVE